MTDFLKQFVALAFPLLLAIPSLPALFFQLLLPGRQRDRLLLQFVLLAADPLLQLSAHRGDLFPALGQTRGKPSRFVRFPLSGLRRQAVVVGEPLTKDGERFGQFRRRGFAGQLGPELFGDQSHFERFAVDARHFGVQLLERRFALIEIASTAFDVLLGLALLAFGGLAAFRFAPLVFRKQSLQALPFSLDALVIFLELLEMVSQHGFGAIQRLLSFF